MASAPTTAVCISFFATVNSEQVIFGAHGPRRGLIPGNGTLVMLDTFSSGNWIVCFYCWRQRMCGWDPSVSCGIVARALKELAPVKSSYCC
ncbi:hypothetical protein AVEN_160006-1 [Araneus ventricosus]|uniref:Uncharacterized protein n=1 Tax=Araneus ventricosus TaxID=182803 RepID=A0A4Y2DMM7_ARAVE|nr:hypothetical protein AVEN_160006-1 [Araneus ventricosus]